ncbi:hypothetical protein HHK36_001647 [Tetracentron sinense]|uniref:HVA22-like protein n=1 Tax=Tetracentron sinense TaxID=13715 RepID=A0A834ZXN0_TETSI|nr:hypothetical protein HHK36_001647 [Tetracentron sinense]
MFSIISHRKSQRPTSIGTKAEIALQHGFSWSYRQTLRYVNRNALIETQRYASMRAIESPSTLDDQQWLTYWVIYSFITLFELSCWKILVWLPFWPYVKLVFCLWLVLPIFNGAAYIYGNLVRKYIKIGGQVNSNYPDSQRKVLQMMTLDARKSVERYIDKYGPDAFDRVVKATPSIRSDRKRKLHCNMDFLGAIARHYDALIAGFLGAIARHCVGLPFWPYVKLVFFLWLVLPIFNGAAYIYEILVRKYLKIGGEVSSNYSEGQSRALQMMTLDARKSAERFIEKYGPDVFDRIVKAAEKEAKKH